MARLCVGRFQAHRLPFVALFVHQLYVGKIAGFTQLSAVVIKFGFHGDKVFFQDPTDPFGIAAVGFHVFIFWRRFRDPAGFAVAGFVFQDLVIPLGGLMADHVAIGKIGADKTILLVAGNQATNFFQRRQIDPDVVILGGILDQQRHRSLHVRRRQKARHAHVVDAVRLQLRRTEGLAHTFLTVLIGQREGRVGSRIQYFGYHKVLFRDLNGGWVGGVAVKRDERSAQTNGQ